MRPIILGTMFASAMLTAVPATIRVSPKFIWNASASVPIGLYHVLPEDHLAVADLVAVTPPESIAKFLRGPQLFAARRTAFEARARTPRTNCLPHPSRHSD